MFTLSRDLNDEQGILHKDCDAFRVSGLEEDAGSDHAEDGVDVCANNG